MTTMDVFGGFSMVVTGAGSGVGRAIALRLAADGARLCLVGRTLTTLSATAVAAGKPAEARCYVADLTDDDSIVALAETLRRDLDGIDVLVHAAGAHAMGDVESASTHEFDLLHRTNLRGPYLLTQALLPELRRRQGQIAFINSSMGVAARGGVAAYAVSKHGLKAFADSLRDEVNAHDVRVVSVYLGRTATPLQAQIHAAENRRYHPELLIQPDDVAQVVAMILALPRTAEVTDVTIRPMRKS